MRVVLFGVPVDPLTLEGCVERIAALVAGGGAHQVVTLNPELLYRARNEPRLREILEGADLVTADGVGILWAARRAGRRLPERVTGIDLMMALVRRAAASGWRVFLLGAAPGVAAEAARRLQELYPNLAIAGWEHGFWRPEEEPRVVAAVKRARPQLLFVALGAPRQEEWIARHLPALGPVVAVGVGGSFDVLAGRVRRAPALLRRLNLEWLGRLVMQPRRWRRMLVLPKFAWLVLRTYGWRGAGTRCRR
ncbi:MAG: WecB/TagA/CpsF family glycosyltransferase [Firmicutes bacterium]|nr:WecB/TagA/CpsF family glycosyltransferase [Bacillota bacterium]